MHLCLCCHSYPQSENGDKNWVHRLTTESAYEGLQLLLSNAKQGSGVYHILFLRQESIGLLIYFTARELVVVLGMAHVKFAEN